MSFAHWLAASAASWKGSSPYGGGRTSSSSPSQRSTPLRPVPRWSTETMSQPGAMPCRYCSYSPSVSKIPSCPGPPDRKMKTPRYGCRPARRRSTRSGMRPGVTPVRSSGTHTVVQSNPVLLGQGWNAAAPAGGAMAAAATRATSASRTLRTPTSQQADDVEDDGLVAEEADQEARRGLQRAVAPRPRTRIGSPLTVLAETAMVPVTVTPPTALQRSSATVRWPLRTRAVARPLRSAPARQRPATAVPWPSCAA